MNLYSITNRTSGLHLGTYLGMDVADAIDAMACDAGYDSQAHAATALGTTVATNDDWETQSATATFTAAEVRELTTKAGAFTLPSGSRDASLLFTTSTNTSYTVLVSGAAGETGVALVEVYDVTGL